MRITFLFMISSALADPCTDLCKRDGPAVCTKGSWTKSNGFCQNYLYRGDPANGEYCYHTVETAAHCPSSGAGVKASDVAGIIGIAQTTNMPIEPKLIVSTNESGLWVMYKHPDVPRGHNRVVFKELRHRGEPGAMERYTQIANSLAQIEGLVTLRAIASFPPNPQVSAYVGTERDGSITVECTKAGENKSFVWFNLLTNLDSFFRMLDKLEARGPRFCAMALAIQQELEARL
jgi:hypothetical protein